MTTQTTNNEIETVSTGQPKKARKIYFRGKIPTPTKPTTIKAYLSRFNFAKVKPEYLTVYLNFQKMIKAGKLEISGGKKSKPHTRGRMQKIYSPCACEIAAPSVNETVVS